MRRRLGRTSDLSPCPPSCPPGPPLWPTGCMTPCHLPKCILHTSCGHGPRGHSGSPRPLCPSPCPPPSRRLWCQGANLGYSAVLQTLLQLQLIIHSGCQRPRRQKEKVMPETRRASGTRLAAMIHTEKEKRADVTHTRCDPLQTPPPNTGTHTAAIQGQCSKY